MADIIYSNRDPQAQKVDIFYPVWQIALLGAFSAIAFWILTTVINNFAIDSLKTSGNVAMIIVATIGVFVIVKLKMAQPLMVAIAVAASLWGLAVWTDGLSLSQIMLWNIIIYTFSYILFSWLARYDKAIVAMLMMLFVIAVIRIVVIM